MPTPSGLFNKVLEILAREIIKEKRLKEFHQKYRSKSVTICR